MKDHHLFNQDWQRCSSCMKRLSYCLRLAEIVASLTAMLYFAYIIVLFKKPTFHDFIFTFIKQRQSTSPIFLRLWWILIFKKKVTIMTNLFSLKNINLFSIPFCLSFFPYSFSLYLHLLCFLFWWCLPNSISSANSRCFCLSLLIYGWSPSKILRLAFLPCCFNISFGGRGRYPFVDKRTSKPTETFYKNLFEPNFWEYTQR